MLSRPSPPLLGLYRDNGKETGNNHIKIGCIYWGYRHPEVDRYGLWVYYKEVPIYPIFYLLKGDSRQMRSQAGLWFYGGRWEVKSHCRCAASAPCESFRNLLEIA